MASRWQTLALGATSQVKIIRSPLDLVALPKQHLVSSERSPFKRVLPSASIRISRHRPRSVQLALGIRLVAVGFGRPVPLCHFLDDGRIELDNNSVERAS
jgi:hypothetical protein